MKISELIEKLQEFKDEYGDLDAYFDSYRLRYRINTIVMKKDEYGRFITFKEVVKK